MCGIAGLWHPTPGGLPLGKLAETMTLRIAHRGPDGHGVWADEPAGVALGHRRLAIVDLTAEGAQPMASASGRYVAVFNGEIYNFLELRDELEAAGARFRGRSDTEVLLAAIERWGVVEALRRSIGMLAIALWDREERALYLARDRLGKKPLAYAFVEGALAFASEITAIEALPGFAADVDRASLALYLQHMVVPGERAIYAGMRKVPPGCALRFSAATPQGELLRYWDPAALLAAPRQAGDEAALVERLDQLLRLAVRQRMISDVPLGAFLSGGVDSSTVVALMQAQSDRPVRTFTIGFDEAEFNEAPHAKAVAEHLGTEHTELYVRPAEVIQVIEEIAARYDEPFADSSQVPTYLLSRLARRHVTVALSGDGGDELFGGYNRYLFADALWRKARGVPYPVRALAGKGIGAIPASWWDGTMRRVAKRLPGRAKVLNNGLKMRKLAVALQARSAEPIYRSLITSWPEGAPVRGLAEAPTMDAHWQGSADAMRDMMYADLRTYLPDDILVKVDRASMAVGLEVRAPLLDARVAEFAWGLDTSWRIRDGQGKWLLRRVLDRYVPRSLIERPKMGFGMPVGQWLQGPLRPWAESLLDEKRLREEGYLDAATVRRAWSEHLSGRRDWQAQLWSVLMLQSWLDARPALRSRA